MTTNKGKSGEMRVLRLLTRIVDSHGNQCDITRHTNTNTADGGADLVLEHPDGLLSHLQSIANQEELANAPALADTPTVKTRIDVKNTEKKIGPEVVIKFAGDVRRNPDCNGHMLMGGSGLSSAAKGIFTEIQQAQRGVGKNVAYIPNSGIENLENHYKALENPHGATASDIKEIKNEPESGT